MEDRTVPDQTHPTDGSGSRSYPNDAGVHGPWSPVASASASPKARRNRGPTPRSATGERGKLLAAPQRRPRSSFLANQNPNKQTAELDQDSGGQVTVVRGQGWSVRSALSKLWSRACSARQESKAGTALLSIRRSCIAIHPPTTNTAPLYSGIFRGATGNPSLVALQDRKSVV